MTVLGIFFALAVLCAGFFAFGYSTGSKSVAKPGSGAFITDATAVPECKPSPRSVAGSNAPAFSSLAPVNVPSAPGGPSMKPTVVSEPLPGIETQASVALPERITSHVPPAALAVTTTPAPAGAEQPTTMVQVAALSRQDDAETVASALKGRGYNVAIHTSGTDNLMHVQLGPFATRKEAESMRQRLLNDGFNAILK